MTERQPDKKLRSMFWTPELEIGERDQAHNRKIERLATDIQCQHGLPGEPRRVCVVFGKPNLTETMMKLIEGFTLALFCELAGGTPPPLRSGFMPRLIELVPEEQLSSVLAALRGAAKHLHDEDDTPTMHVTRFFAKLRNGA